VPPRTSAAPRPGRLLTSLVVLIVIMLLGILASFLFAPASWHKRFKVGLGLDLSSGTEVTLAGQKQHGMSSTQFSQAMSTAVTIMNNRVDGAGFSGSTVVPQGNNLIVVTVPGKSYQQVAGLVGTTAQLRFRQVLLAAPNTASSSPTPTPSATPSPTPTPSSSSSPKASPSATASSAALGGTSAGAGGLSVTAKRLPATTQAAGAAAKPAASPSASASPSPTPSPTPTPAPGSLSTTADGSGDASQLTATTKADFDKLNCADSNWQAQIYGGNANNWDNPNSQIVACYQGMKYALAKAYLTGDMLKNGGASAQLQTNGDWYVDMNFNAQGAKANSDQTTKMYDSYYDQSTGTYSSYLDFFAIVLDGVPQSIAYVEQPTAGTSEIRGTFTQSQADNLVDVLNYGALPLTFQKESIESITPQLGASYLHAGLIAFAIGLFLVVCYSFFYYRGLGIVSVSSLAIAALLSYLSVVLLSDYEKFTMTLAGIAGLVVAIGITADSFVVFFERLRDEVRDGRTLRTAVERGWVRARRTILVSDTVTFIAAALLYKLAVSDVADFGFTLGLTTLVDIIVVFLFTKPMITLLARTEFFGNGHKGSGLDPARLGVQSPWRGTRRPASRPATGGAGGAASQAQARSNPKEA